MVWMDLEMTGLDHRRHRIVEIATVITDDALEVIATGPCMVIGAAQADLDAMEPVVREMHTKSGLLNEIQASQVTLAEAAERTLEFVKTHVPEPHKVPLCGNTIGMDRRFLDQYMPELENYLHYRVIDVSTIKELAKRWLPELAEASSDAKKSRVASTKHRALDDVLESIEELRLYHEHWLTPGEPDPTQTG